MEMFLFIFICIFRDFRFVKMLETAPLEAQFKSAAARDWIDYFSALKKW